MVEPASPTKHTSATYPRPASPEDNEQGPSYRSSSASSSSSSETDQPRSRSSLRRSRGQRPGMSSHNSSSSIIISKDKEIFQRDRPTYPPDDARAMSPRRTSHDLERLSEMARESLKECVSPSIAVRILTTSSMTLPSRLLLFPIVPANTVSCSQARTLQSSLQALADRIDEVKSDHDKLENENRFLQDYIGGLTRTMSQRDLAPSSSGKNTRRR